MRVDDELTALTVRYTVEIESSVSRQEKPIATLLELVEILNNPESYPNLIYYRGGLLMSESEINELLSSLDLKNRLQELTTYLVECLTSGKVFSVTQLIEIFEKYGVDYYDNELEVIESSNIVQGEKFMQGNLPQNQIGFLAGLEVARVSVGRSIFLVEYNSEDMNVRQSIVDGIKAREFNSSDWRRRK